MSEAVDKAPGADTLGAGPLSGIKVLDLSRILTGPLCSMILADMGAEVIKIEEPGTGDQTRTLPPFTHGESPYFLAINRNKQSVCIDLKTQAGRELLLKLAARSDVLLENFRPGVLERLGLGREALMRSNPRLIVCAISGFGQTGPLRDKAAFDLIVQAMSGAMSLTGETDGPPTKMGIPMGDIAAGLWAAIGILAALQKRNATGQGSYIDLSMLEGLMALLGSIAQIYLSTGTTPGRVGSSHHSTVPYGRFEVKDGHMVVAIYAVSFWRKFCAAIGREDLADNPRFAKPGDRHSNRVELEQLVVDVMRTKTAQQWQLIFEAGDVPYAPVHSVGEALEQEVVAQRELLRTVTHRVAGEMRLIGSPLHFEGFDDSNYRPAPLLGEHTQLVLAGLGYADADISKLAEEGAIGLVDGDDGPGSTGRS